MIFVIGFEADRPSTVSYVTELTKLKETFIEPLLHPYASPPVTSPTPIEHDEFYARVESPRESLDHLPIAARFLSPTPGLRPETPVTATSTTMQPPSTSTAKDSLQTIGGESGDTDEEEANDRMGRAYSGDQYSGTRRGGNSAIAAAAAKFNHPRSPYNTTGQRSKNDKAQLPFPSRSHQSLPPPRRMPPQGSTASLGRQSVVGMAPERDREREVSYAATQKTDKSTGSKVLRKLRRSTTSPEVLLGDAVPPHQLPEDLRRCLEVLEGGIYDGHCRLSEGLRKRYEEQYPLVRSLADVFVNNVRDPLMNLILPLIWSNDFFTPSLTFCANMPHMSSILNVHLSKWIMPSLLQVTRKSQKIKTRQYG